MKKGQTETYDIGVGAVTYGGHETVFHVDVVALGGNFGVDHLFSVTTDHRLHSGCYQQVVGSHFQLILPEVI